MRFLNRNVERHFIEMQADMLTQNLFWCGLASGSASLIFILFLATQKLSPGTDSTWRMNVLTEAACMGVSCVVSIAAKMPCVRGVHTPQMREVTTVTSIFILAVLRFFRNPWYGSRILQQEPDLDRLACNSYGFSDTTLVLVLSVFVIVSHLVLPIRWICLLPLEVALGLLYAGFALIVGGPDGDQAWSTFLLLLGLIIFALVGRRTIEDYQRRTFCTIITERYLRAQSEFRLEQGNRSTPAVDHGSASEAKSRPSTTPSCAAFEVDNAHSSACLDKLIALGRQEQWYVDSAELMLRLKVLGEGAFGVVLAGEYHGSPVAVKASKQDLGEMDLNSNKDRLMSFLNELRILRRLRHPNIVLIHGASLDAESADVSIVLERVFGKTLEEIILKGDKDNMQLQPCDRLRALTDISRALRYIHSREPPIVHGDLKASNIIAEQMPGVSGFRRMKLLDFGLARALTRHAMPLGGTLIWVAPEVALYRDRPPQTNSDVFSFGRVALFVLSGTMALADKQRREIVEWLRQGCVPALPWPPGLEPSLERCREHVQLCMEFEAHLRPSMEVVGSFFEGTVESPSREATIEYVDDGPDCQTLEFSEDTGSLEQVWAKPSNRGTSTVKGTIRSDRSGGSGPPGGGSKAKVVPSSSARPSFSGMSVLPGMLEGGGEPSSKVNLPSLQPAPPGHLFPALRPARSRTVPPIPRMATEGSQQGLDAGGAPQIST